MFYHKETFFSAFLEDFRHLSADKDLTSHRLLIFWNDIRRMVFTLCSQVLQAYAPTVASAQIGIMQRDSSTTRIYDLVRRTDPLLLIGQLR
jgi:hypothetical protein